MAQMNGTDDRGDSRGPADLGTRNETATGTHPPATIAATRLPPDANADEWPNVLMIIGQGTPSSFELTVDGAIELTEDARTADVVVRSGTTVEGTIETGTVTVRFTGDLTDVTFVDRGVTGQEPATTPNVHVDYAAPTQ